MDPNLLDFFAAVSNNQNIGPAEQQNAQQSTITPGPQSGRPDQQLGWNPGAAAVLPSGATELSATSASSHPRFSQPSASQRESSFTAPSTSSAFSKNDTVDRSAPTMRLGGMEGEPARKRTKMTSEPAPLDSIDYWINFDDDDLDNKLGGSFEIDFSKRMNEASTPKRPVPSSFNQLSSTPGLGTGLYATPSLLKPEDFIDDSALDHALSDDEDGMDSLNSVNLNEELAKADSMAPPPAEVPPREGLYSTPLSWERPQPGVRMDSVFGGPTMLSEAEQRRLLAIAMNTGRQSSSFVSGLDLGYNVPFKPWFQPTVRPTNIDSREFAEPPPQPSFKGKGKETARPPEDDRDSQQDSSSKAIPQKHMAGPSDKGKEKAKTGDRSAHNDIERKYRTNLKDRIAELRDAVPALRSMLEDGTDETDAQKAPKVSKGTILTKAAEYIHYLERRNKAIMREHQDLARRLQAFEQLMAAAARQQYLMPNHSRTLFDPRGFC